LKGDVVEVFMCKYILTSESEQICGFKYECYNRMGLNLSNTNFAAWFPSMLMFFCVCLLWMVYSRCMVLG